MFSHRSSVCSGFLSEIEISFHKDIWEQTFIKFADLQRCCTTGRIRIWNSRAHETSKTNRLMLNTLKCRKPFFQETWSCRTTHSFSKTLFTFKQNHELFQNLTKVLLFPKPNFIFRNPHGRPPFTLMGKLVAWQELKWRTLSLGPDNISGRVLRDYTNQLADVLTDILDMSLSQATVPSGFKAADLNPHLKKAVMFLNMYLTTSPGIPSIRVYISPKLVHRGFSLNGAPHSTDT